ncbi:3-deoxy-manno-octulosonate cytidylyltransferase [Candidatus Fermentibacteria bacterium]|nr:3-deoxy-manno-octulosonate cytidylyltransferase [Candidatus Fermentibacteria bacterium]
MALGVIPARFGSSRFPGKVLFPLAGKPMVQWVWERARRAPAIRDLLIATDDERVRDTARGFGAEVVMTRADHPSGTSRVVEAASAFSHDIVLNIQADEPLVNPALLDLLVNALHESPWAHVATPAVALRDDARLANPNVVKLVMAKDRRVLFFSRGSIPCGFHPCARDSVTWEHQGIYAFRRSVLDAWDSLADSPLAEAEELEQLRLMDAGYLFVAVIAPQPSPGVNTPDDIPLVERLLEEASL